ncbi:uncharacterized protein YukE [Rhodococcus sp. 27YEA15]|uniref:alpha/beta hydrolase n=1 Tax=Rhodococcus sp. 27YEA15 TaxID=3156259 RepID=UPI003C7A43CF
MRPGISQLRRWSPDELRDVGTTLIAVDRDAEEIVRQARRNLNDVNTFWLGHAAAAAAMHWSTVTVAAQRLSVAIRTVSAVYSSTAHELADARRTVLDLVDDAVRGHGLTVTDTGEVITPEPDDPTTLAALLPHNRFQDCAPEFRRRIADALASVDETDQRAAEALRRALQDVCSLLDDRAAPTNRYVVDVLDGNAFLPDDPGELNRLWRSLSPGDKEALAAWDPAIGRRDGIPAADRDYYNRRYLITLEAGADPTAAAAAGAVRDELRPDTFLLSITPSHVVIAVGDPDSADNVATLVPGTGSGISSVGTDLQRTRVMFDTAGTIAPTEATAVILWSGYESPKTIPEAGRDSYAESAVDPLDAFHDGLRASHEGPVSHNVLIGHSYGSTVIGAASTGENSLAVDDLVFVASPGVDAHRVTDLHLDGVSAADLPRRVHATTAFWDPIRLVPQILGIHGFDPADPAFGAQVFASAPGRPGTDVHSDYWEPGNTALTELGRIITGSPPR